MKKDIYELDLHESTVLECGVCVMRVPSGWIYDMWDFKTDSPKSGVFVPFDNKFDR